MNDTHFFRKATADQFTGSLAYLRSQQSLFRSDQTSGVIEIQFGQTDNVILLYARGTSVGMYHLSF